MTTATTLEELRYEFPNIRIPGPSKPEPRDPGAAGRQMRSSRTIFRFTQDQVAAFMGVSRATVGRIERGQLDSDALLCLMATSLGEMLALHQQGKLDGRLSEVWA